MGSLRAIPHDSTIVVQNERACRHLPAPEPCGDFVETAGPRDQIFHAPRCEQRTVGVETLHAYVFRVGYEASSAELGSLLRFCAQADRTDASYSPENSTAIFNLDSNLVWV